MNSDASSHYNLASSLDLYDHIFIVWMSLFVILLKNLGYESASVRT